MTTVNTDNSIASRMSLKLDTQGKSIFQGVSAGDIISGVLTATDGKKSVITMENGTSFQVDAKSVAAEIGQKISFEVADVHGNSVVMKQINEEKAEEQEELDRREDLTGEKLLNWAKGAVLPITGRTFESTRIMSDERAEQHAELLASLNKIKRDILYSVNNVSNSALSYLKDNGISLGEITVSMLTEAIRSAVSSAGISGEPTEDEVAAALLSYSQNNEMANNAKDIINALLSEDLPPTETNIKGLSGVCERAGETDKMSMEDKIGFLKTGNTPTISNLFTALHSFGGDKPVKQMTEAEWNKLRPAAEKYMEQTGIPNDNKTLDAVRALIANDIPVTKENADFLSGAAKRRDMYEILKDAARNISNGKSPMNVDLYKENLGINTKKLFENYRRIIDALPEITDDAVLSAVTSGKPVTIASIVNAQRELESNNEGEGNEQRDRYDRVFYAEKIKLEEIRLRLTTTAAAQMAKAGISIDTMELQNAIDELKQIEYKNYEAALRITGADASAENTAAMSERSAKIRGLSNTYDSVKRALLNKEMKFTAEEIYTANERAKEQAALEGYEALKTTPNAKFGDSVSKALKQVDNLLQQLGISASPDNIKAAGSLVRTGEDVTKENIETVKAINNKIDTVVNNLHPVISAQMIKEGFNPLTAHIDEVIAYIDRFNEINAEPPVEAVERAILNMDKNGELSKEERDSLIGAYRMLSAISKNETVSAAVIAKSGKRLTLENLMEAGKYYDKSKSRKSVIDRRVDDSDGGRDVIFSDNSIKEQIGRAYKRAVSELPDSGITEEQAEETANLNNLGLTADNMEIMKAVADSEMELSGENIYTVSNIKHSIDELLANIKNQKALEYIKTKRADGVEKEEIEKLLEGMSEFMEKNSQNEAMRNTSESASFSAFKDDLKSLAQVSPQQLAWMASMNLPLTVGNIKTLYNMSGDRDYLTKRLIELNRIAEELIDINALDGIPSADSDRLAQELEQGTVLDYIEDKANEALEKALASASPRKVELFNSASIIENASKVMRQTNDKFFQIPVKLHDKLGSLNVYVINRDAEAENINAFIQLDFNELGIIKGNVNISDGFADIVIGAENPRTAEFLAAHEDILHGYISDLGLDEYKISFKTERINASFAEVNNAAETAAQEVIISQELDVRL